jgi:hypothetical protein
VRTSVIPPDPNLFDGPRVWTTRDFHSPSDWSLSLSDETRNELKSAVDHAKKRGLEPFSREDFPLPSFASTGAEIRRRLGDGIGFVVLRGLELDDYTEDEVQLLYAGIGTYLARSFHRISVETGCIRYGTKAFAWRPTTDRQECVFQRPTPCSIFIPIRRRG